MSSVAMLIDRMKPLVIMKDESEPRRFIWPEDMPEQCPAGSGSGSMRFDEFGE